MWLGYIILHDYLLLLFEKDSSQSVNVLRHFLFWPREARWTVQGHTLGMGVGVRKHTWFWCGGPVLFHFVAFIIARIFPHPKGWWCQLLRCQPFFTEQKGTLEWLEWEKMSAQGISCSQHPPGALGIWQSPTELQDLSCGLETKADLLEASWQRGK